MKSKIAAFALMSSLAAWAQQSTPPIPAESSVANPFVTPVFKAPVPDPVTAPEAEPQQRAELPLAPSGQDLQFMTDAVEAGWTEIEMGRLGKTIGQGVRRSANMASPSSRSALSPAAPTAARYLTGCGES